MIYNRENIISEETGENSTTYILKEGTFISDSFSYLPNGRIDKKVTGIGATYRELTSDRHSIIVEPLRAIASSKTYNQNKRNTNHKAIYVGGTTDRYTSLKPIELRAKINSIKAAGKYVKIVVVADSLWKVIEAIDDYDNYFLMLDEIDTFQTDAGYRSNLEDTMDDFFMFKNSCVVSATLSDFSNPKLMKKPLIVFNYQEPKKTDIFLTLTKKNHESLVAQEIIKYVKSGEKVLVAYNYVEGILNVIEQLPEELHNKCKILCSKNSKNKVEDFYQNLNSDELKAPITFMTSAYFSGIDIATKCHLINVVDGSKYYTLLSLDKLRQVQGRMRNGLLSNHLICSAIEGFEDKNYTQDYLLRCAKKGLKALGCIKRVYEDDAASGDLMNKIRKATSDGINLERYGLVRRKKKKKNKDTEEDKTDSDYQPAYFNIDSLLLDYHTKRDMYQNRYLIIAQLYERYNIVKIREDYSAESKEQIAATDNVRERRYGILVDEIQDALKELEAEKPNLRKLKKEATKLQKRIYSQYGKLYGFLKKEDILTWLEKVNLNRRQTKPQRDRRAFDKFYQSVIFESLVDNHLFKKQLNKMFPLDSIHTGDEILAKINNVYARADIGIPEIRTDIEAVRMLNCYFNVRRVDKGKSHKIIGSNPRKLEVITKLGEGLDTNDMFNGLGIEENKVVMGADPVGEPLD